jgi:hypothetical protein
MSVGDIRALGVDRHRATARREDEIHVLHRHDSQQNFFSENQGADEADSAVERDANRAASAKSAVSLFRWRLSLRGRRTKVVAESLQ